MATGTTESGRTARRDRGRPSIAKRVFALRNWRVRTRLTALILVPTAVGVMLSGARVVTSIESIAEHERTGLAADYASRIRDLTEAVGQERDMGTWASRQKRARFQGRAVTLQTEYEDRQKTVDGLVSGVRADFAKIDLVYGPRVVEAVQQSLIQLDTLKDLRKEHQSAPYTSLVTALLRVHDELGQVSDDSTTIGNFRGLSALAHAKEEASKQRDRLLLGSFDRRLISAQEMEDFIASRARQGERIAEFGAEAGAENVQLLYRTLTDPRRYRAELTKSRAITIVSTGANQLESALLAASDRGEWFEDNTVSIDSIKKIEKKVADDVVTRNRELADAEQRAAAIAGASILALLLLVLALTVFIARSMVSPLRRLRTEALEVAGFRLPNVVRDMRITGDANPPEVQPISVDSRDEIGEVAQAFDEVHRQAVRLAAEEADLRGNISSMFVNLSRRTQTLVERQISLIDGLEKGEEDGKRLGDLFKLDHLATRMRRNSENLLVLAGHEPTRRRSQPAKLVDVVRASLSEVEDYERVQVKVHRTTSVVGSAANDLVHLIAELVENAIQFSPRNTQVMVSSSLIEGGGALLSVSDSGIGMTEEEITEANRRLAEPPVVDVSVSRRMGLFVVGRLALRHGIRAQLRLAEGNGLIAMVLIPPALIVETVQQQTPDWPSTTATAANGGGTTQGFGPFQPSGANAPTGSLFGADTVARREGAGAPSPMTSDYGRPPAPGGAEPGYGQQQPPADRGFGSPARPVGNTTGGTDWSFGTPPPAEPRFPAPPQPAPERGYGTQQPENDLFARGAHDSGGFPTNVPGSDPFARGVSDSGGFPTGAPQSDPFARGAHDSGAFTRGTGGAGDSGGFARPEPPRQEPSVFGRPEPPRQEPSVFGRSVSPADTNAFDSTAFDTGAFGRPPAPQDSRSAASQDTGEFRRRDLDPREAPPTFSAWNAQDDDPVTASMPAVEVSSLESEEEFLPIFASVESAWFRKPDAPPQPDDSARIEAERVERALKEESERLEEWESARAVVDTPREAPQTSSGDAWRNAADEGWRAAAAAAEPSLGGVTSAGLPKRTPKANLVPGRAAATPAPSAAPPMPPVSAERVRNRMASLQQGVRRGRAEVRDDSAPNGADQEEGQ
ncbi:nitrate- and nitrite sensing domain-containing protein [Streptosporangium soli]|nr:nitrate- and nitrite sensing domain-containing protein [Streptosporangium sp. KLBMP 9127]